MKELNLRFACRHAAQALDKHDPFAAMCAYLDTVAFPTTHADYEFPAWQLDASNPNAQAVRDAQVVSLKPDAREPQFLVTHLNRTFVPPTNWVPLDVREEGLHVREDLRKSINMSRFLEVPLARGVTALVTGPSGSGKTRLICEQM